MVNKQLCKEYVKNATIGCEKVSIAELMNFEPVSDSIKGKTQMRGS